MPRAPLIGPPIPNLLDLRARIAPEAARLMAWRFRGARFEEGMVQLAPRSAEAIADLIQRLEAVLICFQRASGGAWRAFRQDEEIFRLDAVDPEREGFVFRITPEGWIDAQFRLPLGGIDFTRSLPGLELGRVELLLAALISGHLEPVDADPEFSLDAFFAAAEPGGGEAAPLCALCNRPI